VIVREPKYCKLAAYDKSVDQIMNFKHLGAGITSNGNLKEEVQVRTIKTAIMPAYLRFI
jgi:hypothetical protein